VEGIEFLMNLVAGNSNKLEKLGLEGNISWPFNVFALGPTSQATLVGYKMQKFTMQVSKWVSHLVPTGQVDACGVLST
jgi:hypothetical protein